MLQVLKITNGVDVIFTYTENGGRAQRSLAIDNRDGLFHTVLKSPQHIEYYLLQQWSVIQNTRRTGDDIPFRLLSSIEVIPYIKDKDTLPAFWNTWSKVYRYKEMNLLARYMNLRDEIKRIEYNNQYPITPTTNN